MVLRKVSKKVPQTKILSKETKNIIRKMLKIAKGKQGNLKKAIMVGLAAPQIGISKRIVLVDLKADGKGKIGDLKVFINPEITWVSKKMVNWYEGCFSIPNICGIVQRPNLVKVKAFDEIGNIWQGKVKGYIARIFLHEIDHLNGKFFVDLISNPDYLHLVRMGEFSLYRNKKMWKNWPKKASLPLALRKLKKV